jgi:hypothetical protein
MKKMLFPKSRAARLLAGTLACVASLSVQAKAEEDAERYVKVSAQGASLSGSKTAFQAQHQIAKSGVMGIEEIKWTSKLDDKTKALVEGRVLTGTEDYMGRFRLTKEELGAFEVGYKHFTTFYDGVGGFFPTNGAWKPLADRNLKVERASLWVDGTLSLPELPVVHLRYQNNQRTGRKETTIWGNTDFTGIPILAVNPITAKRNLVASYMDLSERTETFEGSLKHSFGNLQVQAGVVYNSVSNHNTRLVNRYPGELRPFPAATPPVPPEKANNPVRGNDSLKYNTDTLAFYAKAEMALTDKIGLFAGTQLAQTEGDIWADRSMFGDLQTSKGVVNAVGIATLTNTAAGRPPYSYVTTGSDVRVDVWTSNIGLNLKPLPDLFVTLAAKYEDYFGKMRHDVLFKNTLVNQTTGAVKTVDIAGVNSNLTEERSMTPEVDVRYRGIKNVSLYANIVHTDSPSDEKTITTSVGPSGVNIVPTFSTASDQISKRHGNLKLGANWRCCAALSLRAEYFSKDHRNGFIDTDSASQFVLQYKNHGASLSAVLTPMTELSLTTKYVGSQGDYGIRDNTVVPFSAGKARTHLVGESVDWMPVKGVLLHAGVNIGWDTTQTTYQRVGGAAEWVNGHSDNNYWSFDGLASYAMNKDTSLQLQGYAFKADNHNPAFAYATMPYGLSQKTYQVTAGVKHRFSSKLSAEAKIGYVDSRRDTSGGYTDFKGPLGYVSMTYAY